MEKVINVGREGLAQCIARFGANYLGRWSGRAPDVRLIVNGVTIYGSPDYGSDVPNVVSDGDIITDPALQGFAEALIEHGTPFLTSVGTGSTVRMRWSVSPL